MKIDDYRSLVHEDIAIACEVNSSIKVKNIYNISFNYKHGKVRVYKKVIQALGNPQFIQFLIKPEDKLLFIVGLDHREHDSFPVVLSEDSRRGGMVLNGKRFVRKISEIAGWGLEGTYIVGGTYIEELNVLEFNLENVVKNTTEKSDD